MRKISGIKFKRLPGGVWLSEDGKLALLHTIDAPPGTRRRDWHIQWELWVTKFGLDQHHQPPDLSIPGVFQGRLLVGALEFVSPRFAAAIGTWSAEHERLSSQPLPHAETSSKFPRRS